MRLTRLSLALMLVGALAVACSDDDPTGVTIADLVGTWNATAVTFTAVADTTPATIDLPIPVVTVTAEIEADGSFTFTISVPGTADQVLTGDFEITGANTFSLTADVDPTNPLTGTFSLSTDGNTLTIDLPGTTLLIDWPPENGTPDEADFDAVFAKAAT